MANFQQVSLICFCVFSIAFAAQVEEILSRVKKLYYSQCLENTGSTEVFEKIEAQAVEIHNDYVEAIHHLQPNHVGAFCDSKRRNLLKKLKEQANTKKLCLAESKKFIPEFVRETFEGLLDFLCYNNGEYTKKFLGFLTDEDKWCISKFKKSGFNDYKDCIEMVYWNGNITQENKCEVFTELKSCTTKELDAYCPTSHNLRKLIFNVLFKFVEKPCRSGGILASSFIKKF